MEKTTYKSLQISLLTKHMKCKSIYSSKQHFLTPNLGFLQIGRDITKPFLIIIYLFKSVELEPLAQFFVYKRNIKSLLFNDQINKIEITFLDINELNIILESDSNYFILKQILEDSMNDDTGYTIRKKIFRASPQRKRPKLDDNYDKISSLLISVIEIKFARRVVSKSCLINKSMTSTQKISNPGYIFSNIELIREYFEENAFESLVQSLKNQLEEIRLKNFLLINNFKIYNIIGDGNCLFRSLSHQMVENENNHEKYRQEVCDYIEKNPHHFKEALDTLLEDIDDEKNNQKSFKDKLFSYFSSN